MPLPDFSRFWGMTVHSGSINSPPPPLAICTCPGFEVPDGDWLHVLMVFYGVWCEKNHGSWHPEIVLLPMATMCLRSLPIKPSDCHVPAYSSLYASSRPLFLLLPLPENKWKENKLSISRHPLPPVVSRSIWHFNKMHICPCLPGAHYISIWLWRMNWASELNSIPVIERSMSLTI